MYNSIKSSGAHKHKLCMNVKQNIVWDYEKRNIVEVQKLITKTWIEFVFYCVCILVSTSLSITPLCPCNKEHNGLLQGTKLNEL